MGKLINLGNEWMDCNGITVPYIWDEEENSMHEYESERDFYNRMNRDNNRYGYIGDKAFEPLTAWRYFWLSVLYTIPVIGLIFWISHMCSGKNINRRSYARSYWCRIVAVVLIVFVLVKGFYVYIESPELQRWLYPLNKEISQMIEKFEATQNTIMEEMMNEGVASK